MSKFFAYPEGRFAVALTGLLYSVFLWLFPTYPAMVEGMLKNPVVPRAVPPDVLNHDILITIDEQTLARLGEPPRWDRRVWVDLLEAMHPARPDTVWIDVLFLHPHPGDSFVALNLTRMPFPICLPRSGVLHPPVGWVRGGALALLGFSAPGPQEIPTFSPHPLAPVFAPLAAGFVEFLLDGDGILRRPLSHGISGVETLGAFALCGATDPPPSPRWMPPLQLADIPHVSFLEVLDGQVPPEVFHGKRVWIGATAPSLKDELPLWGRKTPGVLAHIGAHHASLGYGPRSAPRFFLLVHILILWGLATTGAWRWLGVYVLVALSAQVFTGLRLGWIWPQVWPVGMVTVMGMHAWLLRFREQRRERAYLANLFRAYVSEAVLEELLRESPERLTRAHLRELVVMFVDLRGFTGFAERHDPATIGEFLDRYYALVVETVYAHRGTVSKFVGDGVLVVFGDPNPLPEAPCVALRCARELLARLAVLQSEYGVRAGVTLAYGTTLVGHFGPPHRREYSVFGDVVHVAHRLQELSKQTGFPILFTEDFASCCDDAVPVGTFTLRGKKKPVRVFTLNIFSPGPHLSPHAQP